MTSDLKRVLGPVRATALVVGTIIGTGVFKKPGAMAEQLGDAGLVLAAWLVAAALSIAGALTYAELGARVPEAGGEYAYLRKAFGKLPAFLFGWMRFWIGAPGSIASFGIIAAEFLGAVLPIEAQYPGGTTGLAVTFIVALTIVNLLTVAIGSGVQTALTIFKVLAIVGLAAALFVLGRIPDPEYSADLATVGVPEVAPNPSFLPFVAAVLAALWAFDGWNNMPMVGGEVRDPQRNIPIALIVGMVVVTTLYLFADRAYFHVLTVSEVAYSPALKTPVATLALTVAAGPGPAVTVVSLVVLVSALGAMAGSILTGARVPYAMAKDGLFLRRFADVGATTGSPAVSIGVQGVVASALAVSGTFDQLTDAVVFASWIFYGLNVVALFRLRRMRIGEDASYRTPLWPLLPIIFVLLAAVLVVTTIVSQPVLSAIGLAVLVVGLPVYAALTRGSQSA